jgi:aminopeptidase N
MKKLSEIAMKYLFLIVFSFSFAQQTQFVDFKSVSAKINLVPKGKSISGEVIYNFQVIKPIDTIKIDAQNMTFSSLKLNGKTIPFLNTNKQLQLIFPFEKGKNKLTFDYSAKPKQALYFVGDTETNNLQIWTQGQGRYTSNWFPSFDDVNEKLIFDLEIAFDSKYQVVANGILENKAQKGDNLIWNYSMQKPMSSYLLMLAVGKYDKIIQKSKSGIPLEFYLEPENTSKFETTFRYSKRIFDFLETAIGVKYPWKIYRQIPVRDFLYAGMENTTSTLFSTRYVVDSIGFQDRSYTNVDAHELAHHWFGDLITAQSGNHHWLQEGFATYYALLAEKEIYGEDYFYSKMYESAQQLKFASRTDTIPVLNPKASSMSFYQKGAWALFVLHQKMGEIAFKKTIKSYLKKYAFQNVITQNFFDEIKKNSDFDTTKFSKIWLESSKFNTEEANELLLKNKTMQIQFEVDKLKNTPLAEKTAFFAKILQSDAYFSLKEAIVYQLKNEKSEDKLPLLKLALVTKNIPIRQAVASVLNEIPEDFRVQYETLLDDKSYQTQEIVLFHLWKNFPEKRGEYLEKSKNWIGFNDFNIRTLWLSLAISTPNYQENKTLAIDELVNYSSANYESSTRQDALEKLINFNLINDLVLKNLVNATTHHVWQFSKFGRENSRLLLKKPEMRLSFERILPNLNEKEQFQLNRLLKEAH